VTTLDDVRDLLLGEIFEIHSNSPPFLEIGKEGVMDISQDKNSTPLATTSCGRLRKP
jgi:hypothetical protein